MPDPGAFCLPAGYIQNVALVESGGNSHAHAPSSSAAGLFQFTVSTWAWIKNAAPGLHLTLNGRTDPTQATRALIWFTQRNAVSWHDRFGRWPSPGECYLMHVLGSGRGIAVAAAPATEALVAIVGEAVVAANPQWRGYYCVQMVAWAHTKMGEPGPPVPLPPAPPLTDADALNQRELDKEKPRSVG